MSTNKKISELTELAEADLADDDLLPIVDISNNATKKVRKSTLTSALAGVSTITATSPIAVNQSTGAVTISTGTIPITSGGTGQTSAAAALSALGGVNDPTTTRGDLLSRGASTIGRIPLGSVNNVLKSDGTDPVWGLVATSELSGTINLTNQVSGILPTGNGGTGLSVIGSAGQVLTVNSGGSGLEWAEGVTASAVSIDRFSGTGSQTAFTLSTAPSSENVTQVFISGVYQQKDTYSISGSVITFNTAPPSGTDNIEITDTGASFYGVSPSIGTVTTGAAGSNAAVSITSGGVMSFTIPRGDTGTTGATGSAGTAATITVGTTTTGNAGTSASVTNTGSSSAATFNFTIPKGDTGATGSTGSPGSAATIAVGTTTTGAAGTNAAVTNSGSSSAATFDFTIPRGDTGATGTAGATGSAATIAAGTATGLAAGAAPTVTNSGSSSAATFDFGIPAGATGATGSPGAAATIAVGTVTTGAAGSSATVTNVGSSSAATFDFSIPQGAAGTGSGDVAGPASSTDNAIARFDATTGKLLQNSTVTLSDAGVVSTGTNANLELDPNGSGKVVFKGNTTKGSGQFVLNCEQNSHGVTLKGPPHSAAASYTLTLPNDDGNANQVLKTDGSGTLAWVDQSSVTLAGSLNYLTISGQTITQNAIDLATDTTGTLAIASGGTGATSASAARTALSAAASGANSDITSLTGLTTDLTVAQGGTGASTFTANGVLVGNGTGAVTATAVGTSGQILTSNGAGSAPTFQDAAGGGATDIDGLSDGVTNSSGGTVGLGTEALANDDGSANQNTALGYQALRTTNSNFANTAVGYQAGYALTGTGDTNYGRDSSLFGASAGRVLTTGRGNTAFGAGALDGATTPDNNAAFGREAGGSVTTGASNVFVGPDAGYTTTTGSNNIILGNSVEASSATVSNEITLGNSSVDKFRIPGINFTVKDSTATENYVLTVDASGEAGWEAVAGGATDINGLSDALTNSFGATVGIGSGALVADDGTTNYNTAVGNSAFNDVTSGSYNVALGWNAGAKLTTGRDNTYIGQRSGGGYSNGATVNYNTAVGSLALGQITTGGNNTAVGYSSGQQTTSGTENTSLGHNAGRGITTHNYCVALGKDSMYNNSGDYNTAVGYSAGYTAGAGNNTMLGRSAVASSSSATNEITLGNSSISSLRCQVQTISSLSDKRDKKDIEELPLGIDFINTLKPVKFTWNMRDGAKVGQQEAGFIAQDLDEAQIDAGAEDYLSLVLKNNPEKLEASYGKLVPVLVKAVQELSAEVATLKKEIENGK